MNAFLRSPNKSIPFTRLEKQILPPYLIFKLGKKALMQSTPLVESETEAIINDHREWWASCRCREGCFGNSTMKSISKTPSISSTIKHEITFISLIIHIVKIFFSSFEVVVDKDCSVC